ncbi:hypothetical protein ACFWN1_32635 [Streptomyces sp. NPDC058459]
MAATTFVAHGKTLSPAPVTGDGATGERVAVPLSGAPSELQPGENF